MWSGTIGTGACSPTSGSATICSIGVWWPGYAVVSTYPPNVRYEPRFEAAQAVARATTAALGRVSGRPRPPMRPRVSGRVHPVAAAGSGLPGHQLPQLPGAPARSAELRRRPQRHRLRDLTQAEPGVCTSISLHAGIGTSTDTRLECSRREPSDRRNTGRPSSISRRARPAWIARWCWRQRRMRFDRAVGPPSAQWATWCASHHVWGRSQPGKRHRRSRTITARRIAGGTTFDRRPTSSGSERSESTTRITVASQARRRAVPIGIGPTWSVSHTPSTPVNASAETVIVTCGSSPPTVGRSGRSSHWRQTSPSASARR